MRTVEPLGGHGLTSAIVNREVNPEADPLGPGNVLVYAAGIFRRHDGPQRGPALRWRQEPADWRHQGGQLRRVGRACAGRAGPARRQGRRSGRGALSCSWSARTGRQARRGTGAEGLGSFETVDRLWKQYGDKVSLICTGPAGERGARAAAVLVTTSDHYMRAAARGGLGAVMGAKQLKAIVIDDAGGPGITVADPASLKAASKALTTGIHSHPAMAALEALGSAFLVNVTQSMGCLATKDFSAGTVRGRAGHHRRAHGRADLRRAPTAATKHSCMKGCIINCSQVYTDDAGEVASHRASSSRRSGSWAPTAISTTSTRSRASTGSATISVSTPWRSGPPWGSPWRAASSSGATVRELSPAQRAHDRRRGRAHARRRLRRHGQAARRRARARGQGPELRRLRPARAQGHRDHLRHQPAGRGPHVRQRAAESGESVATTRERPRARRRSPSSCSATSRPSTRSACACSPRSRRSTCRSCRVSS